MSVQWLVRTLSPSRFAYQKMPARSQEGELDVHPAWRAVAEEDLEKCCMCLEAMLPHLRALVNLPCEHVFHVACFRDYEHVSESYLEFGRPPLLCPLCRQAVDLGDPGSEHASTTSSTPSHILGVAWGGSACAHGDSCLHIQGTSLPELLRWRRRATRGRGSAVHSMHQIQMYLLCPVQAVVGVGLALAT